MQTVDIKNSATGTLSLTFPRLEIWWSRMIATQWDRANSIHSIPHSHTYSTPITEACLSFSPSLFQPFFSLPSIFRLSPLYDIRSRSLSSLLNTVLFIQSPKYRNPLSPHLVDVHSVLVHFVRQILSGHGDLRSTGSHVDPRHTARKTAILDTKTLSNTRKRHVST